jgi:hypothetical protein
MQAAKTRRYGGLVLLVALMLAATGCQVFNRTSETRIVVKFSGDNLVHMVLLPKTLADGKSAEVPRKALLKRFTDAGLTYVLLPDVRAGVKPSAEEAAIELPADLLLVQGPPAWSAVLRETLRKEFGLVYPWVASIPTQAIALIPVPAPGAPEEQP